MENRSELRASKKKKRDESFANAILGRAQAYLFLGKNDLAIDDCIHALSKDLPMEEKIKIKLVHSEILLRGKKDFKSADNIVTDLINKNVINKSSEKYTQALNLLGGINRYAGNLDKALEYYHRSLELNKKGKLHYNIGIISSNIAACHHMRGQLLKAKEFLESALNAFIKSGDAFHIEEKKKDLGLIQMQMGDYDDAENSFIKYLKTSRELGYKKGEAEVLNFLGYLYKVKGDLDQALKYRKNYMRVANEMNDSYLLSSAMNSVAIIYQEQEKYVKAERLLISSLKIAGENGYSSLMVGAYLNLIAVYQSLDNFKMMIKTIRESEKIIKSTNNPNYVYYLNLNYGRYYFSTKNYQKGSQYFLTAKKNAEKMENRKYTISSWVGALKCKAALKDTDVIDEEQRINTFAKEHSLTEFLKSVLEEYQ